MKNIASYIEIEYSNKSLILSSMGSPWKGNSTTDEKFFGISKSRVNEWMNEISSLEASFINLKFNHVVSNFGYEEHSSNISNYLPVLNENLLVLIANRFYWLSSKKLKARQK